MAATKKNRLRCGKSIARCNSQHASYLLKQVGRIVMATKKASRKSAKKSSAKSIRKSTSRKSSGRKATKKTASKNSAAKKTSSKKSAAKKSTRSTARKSPAKKSTKKSSSRKYSPSAGNDVKREMHEMKRGKLKSGRSGKKVTSRKQAIAIGLSEARKKGKKVPKKKS